VESSFIISPVSADFSDVWSEPELLSSKGHNAIYVATRFGRRYILKALAEPYRESTPHVEMLRKEFTIGVGVDHPNIVRLIDFGRMDSIGWYIQMEYIDGITLDQFLETKPSVATRRKLLEQLLDALSFLHERQIIHRDIKPSNILITRNGTTVKLIDFGVSDTDDYVTFKQPAGSMSYIAPEQLAGKTIDNRADIYALGRIIALLFPHRYRCIARRCTRVEPARRYSSCAHVARALKRLDNLRLWLPLSLLLLLIPCAAIWGIFTGYQRSERAHYEQESELFAHIDSLNSMVNSIDQQLNTPTPQEVLDDQAKQIFNNYISRVEKAIKTKDLSSVLDQHPTPTEQFWQEVENVQTSLGDNMELLGSFNNSIRHYYYSLYVPFVNETREQLRALARSDDDLIAIGIEPM
jgi:serine/threonine protein kinase